VLTEAIGNVSDRKEAFLARRRIAELMAGMHNNPHVAIRGFIAWSEQANIHLPIRAFVRNEDVKRYMKRADSGYLALSAYVEFLKMEDDPFTSEEDRVRSWVDVVRGFVRGAEEYEHNLERGEEPPHDPFQLIRSDE
jgi:hypothetical protein